MIAAQPNTYAIVGVDEASPNIFSLLIVGWAGPFEGRMFHPVALISMGLEDATKRAVHAGEAHVIRPKLAVETDRLYLLDVITGMPTSMDRYRDRFKIVFQHRKRSDKS